MAAGWKMKTEDGHFGNCAMRFPLTTRCLRAGFIHFYGNKIRNLAPVDGENSEMTA